MKHTDICDMNQWNNEGTLRSHWVTCIHKKLKRHQVDCLMMHPKALMRTQRSQKFYTGRDNQNSL